MPHVGGPQEPREPPPERLLCDGGGYGKSSGGDGGVKGGSPYGGKGSKGGGDGASSSTEVEPVKGKGKGKSKEAGLLYAVLGHIRILRAQVEEIEDGLERWFQH